MEMLEIINYTNPEIPRDSHCRIISVNQTPFMKIFLKMRYSEHNWLNDYLSACLSIYLSIYLPACLPVIRRRDYELKKI
jgi:hypothetical protein